jgi:adenylylsulfate kinase
LEKQRFTIWLTGLPSSGKRTLASDVARGLKARTQAVEVIDSGKLRGGPLGTQLGFSRDDRDTNVRRHALAAQLLARNGVVAVVSAVSPYRATRDNVRAVLGRFVEVHVATPPEVCAQWDQSGTWARALAGELSDFTGVDGPYEAPLHPEVRVDLSQVGMEEAARLVLQAAEAAGWLEVEMGPDEATDEVHARLGELGYQR